MITVTLTGSTAVAAPLALAIFGDPWVLGAVYGLRGVAVGVLVAVWNTTLQTQVARGVARPRRRLGLDGVAGAVAGGLALAGPLAESFGVAPCAGSPAGSGLVAAFWVLLVKDVWRLRPAAVLAGGSGPRPPDARLTAAASAAAAASAEAAASASAGGGCRLRSRALPAAPAPLA